MRVLYLFIALCLSAPSASALEVVKERAGFLQALAGQDLVIPIYRLRMAVSPEGQISGRAAGWDITGQWDWKDGYFCRSLTWGGTPIPFNCQQVKAGDGKMRFTSDQGKGMTALFRLRPPE